MARFTIFIGLIVMLIFASCKDGKRYHDQQETSPTEIRDDALTSILQFRDELNQQFRDPENSPLPDRYRKDFEELEFFAPDMSFRVMAFLERTPEALPFLMPTTTDRKVTERVYGIAHFELENRKFELEVYQNLELLDQEEYESYLFLPFADETNGEDTYTGGRYIDLSIPEGDSLLIDFNQSYNPYCVYNKKYSCPIVPQVNHLETEVRAGIKMFKKKGP